MSAGDRKTAIGVVGLGAMGSRIARRLLEADHDVLVWNRTAEKKAPLVSLGATDMESPAEAARRAGAVITMVSDPAALRSVVDGPDGLAAGAGPGTTLIEMSTVGPAAVAELRNLLPQQVGLLDAPVLGSLTEVESGSLTIFVGGPDPLIERWTGVLSALGSPLHVGPLGAGAAAKLVANSTLLVVLGLIGETLALGQALGLPRRTAFEILSATPIAAQANRRQPAVERGEYPTRFHLSHAHKDADLITENARASGMEPRLIDAVRSWFTDADRESWGDRDYSEVIAWIIRSLE